MALLLNCSLLWCRTGQLWSLNFWVRQDPCAWPKAVVIVPQRTRLESEVFIDTILWNHMEGENKDLGAGWMTQETCKKKRQGWSFACIQQLWRKRFATALSCLFVAVYQHSHKPGSPKPKCQLKLWWDSILLLESHHGVLQPYFLIPAYHGRISTHESESISTCSL